MQRHFSRCGLAKSEIIHHFGCEVPGHERARNLGSSRKRADRCAIDAKVTSLGLNAAFKLLQLLGAYVGQTVTIPRYVSETSPLCPKPDPRAISHSCNQTPGLSHGFFSCLYSPEHPPTHPPDPFTPSSPVLCVLPFNKDCSGS